MPSKAATCSTRTDHLDRGSGIVPLDGGGPPQESNCLKEANKEPEVHKLGASGCCPDTNRYFINVGICHYSLLITHCWG